MSVFAKCFSDDRAEASYFSAIFSIFSAISATCAVFNDQWVTIQNRDLQLSSLLYKNSSKLIPLCSNVGARLFWSVIPADSYAFRNNSAQAMHTSSFRLKDTTYVNCISPSVAYLFYCAISLCFVIATVSVCAATFHVLLPSIKFLEWLRKCVILEACNVCSGAFSCIAAIFSLYQSKLVGRARRAENQRFICTRALRSWRAHVENSRHLPSSNNPSELEHYLLGATIGQQQKQKRSDTISSCQTILPISEFGDQ